LSGSTFGAGDRRPAGSAVMAAVRDVRLEQRDRLDWAVSAGDVWGDPAALLDHLRRNTNHVAAAARLDWRDLCGGEGRVLDLGCGAGWLTGTLSREDYVRSVVAWDSSRRLLEGMLSATVELVGGEMGKVEPVCGEFVPLLLEDDSIDLAVMSSAFHHCDSPLALLEELRRVLRPGAPLVLLNETPMSRLAMLSFSLRMLLASAVNLLGRRSRLIRPGHLAADHVLVDPELGDRALTIPQWRGLAARAGWSLDPIDTGLPPYVESFRARGRLEPNLTHIVLRPAGPA